jgi:hypothetical protein
MDCQGGFFYNVQRGPKMKIVYMKGMVEKSMNPRYRGVKDATKFIPQTHYAKLNCVLGMT